MPRAYRSRKRGGKDTKDANKEIDKSVDPFFFVKFGSDNESKAIFNTGCRCNSLLDSIKSVCVSALDSAIQGRLQEILHELKVIRRHIRRLEAKHKKETSISTVSKETKAVENEKVESEKEEIKRTEVKDRKESKEKNTTTGRQRRSPKRSSKDKKDERKNNKGKDSKSKKDNTKTKANETPETKDSTAMNEKESNTGLNTLQKLEMEKAEEKNRLAEQTRLAEELKVIADLTMVDICDMEGNNMNLRNHAEEYAYKYLQARACYKLLRIDKDESGGDVETTIDVNV
mmetsp:Transcript_6803/g.10412  ORF Transcript_6803/g.10412 Transcript_6803/m.10412 type:complete len:287 (+) Transcript_6803:133-993(+)|eukprot:CAMPEP_0167740984 /NCGR_PEP_ID=MMETSP0110_2-20121227/600_1 /TAXON_ID=629695 /ORGANISM="Gymnochlora sp., Strain CCMP2014" /LENGTH=286 /DNA_ID=CAMNT_0007624977 /DNA_START=94 /DNA_END=954 /DNA_ORIENTATION=-